MIEREQLQQDVLKELIAYSENLIPAVQNMIEELKEKPQTDTNEYLGEVIKGINWEIEVYNQCASVINARTSYIDKKTMTTAVNHLGEALNSGDRMQVAQCFEEDFLPFLNKLALAAEMVITHNH